MKKLLLVVAATILLALALVLGGCIVRSTKIEAASFPDWLKGTLCIKLQGLNSESPPSYEDKDEYLLRKTYMISTNFSNATLTAQEIPKDSNIIRSDEVVMLAFHGESGTYSEMCWNDNNRWNTFYTAYYDENVEAFRDGYESFRIAGNLEVLGYGAKGEDLYFLKYGVSEDGELELQLVCMTDGDEKVFERISVHDRVLDRFRYAISSGKWIAWTDPITGNIKISNGLSTTVLPDTKKFLSMYWLNEEELIYFQNAANAELRVYNVNSGRDGIFYTKGGSPIYIEENAPIVISANTTGDMLAIYSIPPWNVIANDLIHIISLESGEHFEISIEAKEEDNFVTRLDKLWKVDVTCPDFVKRIFIDEPSDDLKDTDYDVQLCWLP